MILALLLVLQGGMPSRDTLPVVTLRQALEQATRLDPDYVAAVQQLDNAGLARRAARWAFLIPTINATTSYTRLSSSQFNLGTGQPATASANASLTASYELFNGGRNIFTARQTSAALDAAQADEVAQRFAAAVEVERAYYDVLGARELVEVARQRRERADTQFALARSRVLSGATVQSDSLQVLLELERARTDQLRRQAQLDVARLELGRRVGRSGAVDAAPLDTAPPSPLPLSLDEAVALAVEQGPAWREARANERSAELQLKARRSSYLPTLAVNASLGSFDDKFFPSQTTRRTIGFTLSLPIWDGAQRELAVARLASARNVARAVREDLERAARHDVTEAWTGYQVARQTQASNVIAVGVATEVVRVQESRYRAGAGTVLELLDAQAQLVQSQADLVQARYATLLARAGLEALLGRRLSPDTQGNLP